MPIRWTVRIAACAFLLTLTACASAAQPQPSLRPNEIQVIEPAGQPDKWMYAPAVLAIAKGTAVSIVNHGKEFHTVTADAPNRPFDISIDTGQTVTFTFNTVGVFTFHCGVHPQMTGTVRVCDGACG